MALLLSRRLLCNKVSNVPRDTLSIRLFSSLDRTPYMAVGGEMVGDTPSGEKIGNLKFYDPSKDQVVTVKDKILPKVLVSLDMRMIGSSHGWNVCLNESNATVTLSDEFKASSLMTKMITLPPIVPLQASQTKLVTSVSMSSSCPEDKDCVVAVKFWGPQLSFCRPACDSEWTNITTPNSSFYSSPIMYSNKDHVFYSPTLGGHYASAWDLINSNHTPKLQKLNLCDIPHFSQSEWELLDSCFTSQHLVECSSTGQSFIIKCYGQSKESLNDSGEVVSLFQTPKRLMVSLFQTPKRLMVFSIEEEGNKARYTEDIGDVCIFISKAEPFCLNASSFPGLEPNSVYFIDSGFGVYNLATRTIRTFNIPKPRSFGAPFWLPPPIQYDH